MIIFLNAFPSVCKTDTSIPSFTVLGNSMLRCHGSWELNYSSVSRSNMQKNKLKTPIGRLEEKVFLQKNS